MPSMNRKPPSRSPVMRDAFVRSTAATAAIGVVASVVARAPTFLQDVEVLGMKFSINAGWVLVFGPFLLFMATSWLSFFVARDCPATGKWGKSDRALARVLVIAVPTTVAFLSLQYFLLLAPSSTACGDGWKLLLQPNHAPFQPTYCMTLPDTAQKLMPHVPEPFLQAWVQAILPMVSGWLIQKAWVRWSLQLPPSNGNR